MRSGFEYRFMRHLYEAIDFLPMMMQPPIVALIVILVGYFLSKVFAAIVHAAIPKNTTEEKSNILPLDVRVTRTCFWGSWLICILIGFNQLPLLSSVMSKWQIGTAKLPMQTMVIAGAILLLTLEKWLVQPLEKFEDLIKSIKRPKIHKAFGYIIIRFSWVFIAVISGFALSSPRTFSLKVAASFLMIVLGFFLGKVVKTTFSSVIGIQDNTHNFLPKILFYFVFVTFLVTSLEIWIH